ncbi:MAG TPA: AbrB/MazE/SpoVT family DNA-binding domain-containing protein [Thermoanaerobaculia bacterium]|nr:AbrB/MazE/SpoVT family DNA-binding domain-containing protein [Thermoanaerobaculia bacterium]
MTSTPLTARHARLFRNGRNQALRIPRELELPGDEVVLYREGDRLVVEPVPRKRNRLSEFLATLPPTGYEIPEIEDPPIEPEEIF